jgi:hypothetical protein
MAVMDRRVLHVLAIVLTGLALVPSGAHLFAFPNKIGLDVEAYFVVQGIYRGWALFGGVLFGALLCNGLLSYVLRGSGLAFALAATATTAVALTLVIFFLWTYPANVATANWTIVPADWRRLHDHWEYSHAANALITFGAFCCLTIAAFRGPGKSGSRKSET